MVDFFDITHETLDKLRVCKTWFVLKNFCLRFNMTSDL